MSLRFQTHKKYDTKNRLEDGWRTEQSRRVIQCKWYEQKIDIFKVWLS